MHLYGKGLEKRICKPNRCPSSKYLFRCGTLFVDLTNRCVGVEVGKDQIRGVTAGGQGGGSELAEADAMTDASAMLGRAFLCEIVRW